MSIFRTLLVIISLAVVTTGAASAALIPVRDDPANGSSVFPAGLSRTISIEHDGNGRKVRAGVFSLEFNEGDGWTDFYSFCLQLSESLSLPREHERVSGAAYFSSAEDLDALGILYGALLTPAHVLKNANTAAAAQAIIWEIIEDGATSFDLASGSFRLLTQDVLAEADALWALVTSGQFTPAGIDVFVANGTQDLLTSSVPIPGALPLLISGIAGLGFASRKQRRA